MQVVVICVVSLADRNPSSSSSCQESDQMDD